MQNNNAYKFVVVRGSAMHLDIERKLGDAGDFQNNYEWYVWQAARYINKNVRNLMQPKLEFGIVLGSGLGDLADMIQNKVEIPYENIPHFPRTTVQGHEGKLIFGELQGVRVVGLKGRKHYYEVADEPFNTGMLQAVFPVHVLAGLGVRNYFVTNAAGGLNPSFNIGDLMVIRSHINMQPNPLLGRLHAFKRIDNGEPVLRFQPMNEEYNPELRERLSHAGEEGHIHEGVYLAVTGPSYETKAECLLFRDCFKADAVGMSTAPEVVVARSRGMNVVGMSCITNKIAEDGTNATNHEEVKAVLASQDVRSRITGTVQKFFAAYREHS